MGEGFTLLIPMGPIAPHHLEALQNDEIASPSLAPRRGALDRPIGASSAGVATPHRSGQPHQGPVVTAWSRRGHRNFDTGRNGPSLNDGSIVRMPCSPALSGTRRHRPNWLGLDSSALERRFDPYLAYDQGRAGLRTWVETEQVPEEPTNPVAPPPPGAFVAAGTR
jgi:hypothetical protein